MEVVVYTGKMDNKKWIMLNCHSKSIARSNVCWKQKNKSLQNCLSISYDVQHILIISNVLPTKTEPVWDQGAFGQPSQAHGVVLRVSCARLGVAVCVPGWVPCSSTYSMILGFYYSRERRKGMRVSYYILYSIEVFLWAGNNIYNLFSFILFWK